MDRIDRGAVGGTEGDVQLPGLRTASRAEPEAGNAVGAREAHHHALAGWETHHLVQPEWRKDPLVEGERRLHVGHLHAKMIEHGERVLTPAHPNPGRAPLSTHPLPQKDPLRDRSPRPGSSAASSDDRGQRRGQTQLGCVERGVIKPVPARRTKGRPIVVDDGHTFERSARMWGECLGSGGLNLDADKGGRRIGRFNHPGQPNSAARSRFADAAPSLAAGQHGEQQALFRCAGVIEPQPSGKGDRVTDQWR